MGAFTDTRTETVGADGALWLRKELQSPSVGTYNLITVDSTDYGAAESLFTDQFYEGLVKLMADESVMIINVDSPSWNMDIVIHVQSQISRFFKYCYIYQSHQPTLAPIFPSE
eukprot:NODE_4063_length_700_cov_122.591398_g3437_i0.p1 GENE.NODE_4063_length_700_cov_122.591398_g3437_i0~~NODE_4063_length_700_cov_122.591398_g3437_i0.p1  ORF type:complete len:121 (-),score=40.83 NODE_4063_length_700_cov_122.591398_g3437_i0:337-675(-)